MAAERTPAELAEAQGQDALNMNHLMIGPPFAMCGEGEFIDTDKANHIGSVSCIKCDCGQAFKIDLLTDRPKVCPGCRSTYTHMLIVCRVDDPDMFNDVVEQVLENNGIEPPGSPDEAEEEADDTQADDDNDEPGDDDNA